MKTLKFRPNLVTEILEGRKTTTWRLFDDKNLSGGDAVQLCDSETGKVFADAEITHMSEKKLRDIEEEDFAGHEKYQNAEEMLQTFKKFYGDKVTLDTSVKILGFRVVKFI